MPNIENFIEEITGFFINIPDFNEYQIGLEEFLNRDSIKRFPSCPSCHSFFDCANVVLKKYREAGVRAHMTPMPVCVDTMKAEDLEGNQSGHDHAVSALNFFPLDNKPQQDQLPFTDLRTRPRASDELDYTCYLV